MNKIDRLPEGYSIEISMSDRVSSVKLFNPSGEQIPFEEQEDIMAQIFQAVSEARREANNG